MSKKELKEYNKLLHDSEPESIDDKITASIMAYESSILEYGSDAAVVGIMATGIIVLLFNKIKLVPSRKEELLNMALNYGLKALDIRKKLNINVALSQSYEVLSSILNGLKRYDDALFNIDKAISILKKDDDFNKKKLLELEAHKYEYNYCKHGGFSNSDQVLEFEKMKNIMQSYNICNNCKKDKCKSKCSACCLVYYCSPECQKENWKEHKKECRK